MCRRVDLCARSCGGSAGHHEAERCENEREGAPPVALPWAGGRDVHHGAIGPEYAGHETVDHSVREYVRGNVSTNRAEGFFSQLKRSVDGTHHHVSRAHLNRYLGEFAFRSSTHEISDTERMMILMGQEEVIPLSPIRRG